MRIHHPSIYIRLVESTRFLSEYYKNKPIPSRARIYCVEHGITESPKCHAPNCSNLVGWNAGSQRFDLYCCAACREKDPEFRDKVKQSCIEHLGVDNPAKAECVKEKIRNTNMKKRGVPYAAQSSEVKQKMIITVNNRYDVDNVFQSPEIK